jgi:hypothetical protein
MINPNEKDIRRRVIYNPGLTKSFLWGGVIIKVFSSNAIFVKYDTDYRYDPPLKMSYVMLTWCKDLEYDKAN